MDFFLITIAVAFLGATVFAIGYGFVDWRTHWFKFVLGQQIFFDQFVIALMLGTTLARVKWHIPFWVSAAEFVLLDVAVWWRVIIWLKMRRRGTEKIVKADKK